MKISYNWLKTLVDVDLSAQACGELLTAAGLEVEHIESYETIQGGLKGLVVGEVLQCEKHPDADKLKLTKVTIGNGSELSIVCGAPNVAAGQKVVVATVGTKLFPSGGEPFEIKKSKIRGAVSEGMLCAEDEIGLGQSHAGIMVLPENTPAGMAAADYFKIENDFIFEIGLTPNRGDASSHYGVARDLVAILNSNHKTQIQLKKPASEEIPASTDAAPVEVIIEDKVGCPRYSGIFLTDVTVKDSPEWLQNRLRSIGVRPINNVVDITNFVLHELGQPLHAFDATKIKGNKIIVRKARKDEKFVTLDDTERTLSDSDLVIADEKDTLCIAGVFGGAGSGVTASTTRVFLESAYFDPSSIRSTSKRHSLKTDASFRFERGTDPDMTVTALRRAADLLQDIAGAKLAGPLIDVINNKPEAHKVAFSYSNCTDLIGKEIDRGLIRAILLNLQIEIDSEGNDGLLLKVPRYKSDVTREADVIEEVLRIYGYNHVEPARTIGFSAFNSPKNFALQLEEKFSSLLEGIGFRETMGVSLTKSTYYPESENLVTVLNPLSADLNVLRAEMMQGGLEAIAYNINRKNPDLKFFEFGRTYGKDGEKYKENKHLALFLTGRNFPENPFGLNTDINFPVLKQVVTVLLEKCGIGDTTGEELKHDKFAYGLTLSLKQQLLVELGEISPLYLKKFSIQQPVFYADLKMSALEKLFSKQKIEFTEISKFPAVRRDLALLLDRKIEFNKVKELAQKTERKLLREVQLFDVYEGEKLGNKKSYAVSFTLQNNEATLTDKQIDSVMEKLIKVYKEELGAELR